MTERIGDLEFATAVRAVLPDSGHDARDDAARALMPFLTSADAAVVAAATAVLEVIANVSDAADVLTELAELAAARDSEAAEIADEVLVALTPSDTGHLEPDLAALPASPRAVESVRQIVLTGLAAAFSGLLPSEFSPVLARDAGRGALTDDVDERVSGLLENDELGTFGLSSSYEYRVLAGGRKGTVTIIVDFEPLDLAVAVDAVVKLVSSEAGETVAQSTLRGRRRVRRVSFRDLDLADGVWGSLAVSIAKDERES